jgi:hypothetical protein
MVKRGRGIIGFVAGAVVATTLTATTVAIASEARGGGTLHACAAKHGGALRIAKSCKSSERAVTWNVTGPKGARGPKGKAGADGSGPAYTAREVGLIAAPSGTPAAITHVTLPPGDYTVVATLNASTSNVGGDNGFCELGGAGFLDETQSSFTVTTDHSESVTLTGIAVSTDVNNQVFLECGGDHAVTIDQGMLTATQVTQRVDQTPAG